MVVYGSGGIILKDNKILLIKRKNNDYFNDLWSNPGGKVEPNESSEDAVIRELKEELDIEVKIVKKISDYHDYKEGTLFGIYSGYEVEILKGTPKINEPHKITEIKYFSADKLPKKVAPYTLQYIKNLQ